ncbi:MAG TPA: ANTAR domain-containing protein [Jatrophihabitans sp.]|jgi:hypothetical protein|uniref:ANTAR domain-containing protein n=1 Tax=Jatrophihabitans sp. TaxID=1932789 RepID=UPI002EE80701
MSVQSAPFLTHRPSAHSEQGLGPILQALDGLVASAEPAVVFTSVTRLCVPSLCDAATVAVMTAEHAYKTAWPWNGAHHEDPALLRQAMAGKQVVSHNAVLTPILGRSIEGVPDYRGVLTMAFHTLSPSAHHGVLAQLVVERAMAVIERERLAEILAARQAQADNLRIALTTNRCIGTAIGILMANHKLTSEAAFDLLRRVSQHSNRKMHDLAIDVIDTGALTLPAGVTATPSLPSSPDESPSALTRPRPRPFPLCTPRP